MATDDKLSFIETVLFLEKLCISLFTLRFQKIHNIYIGKVWYLNIIYIKANAMENF